MKTITSAHARVITARVITARAILVMLTLFACLIPTQANAQALPREIRQKILKAVVQVIPLKDNGEPVGWSGSGTIISESGYITIAEQTPTKEEFPTAPPENLVAGSTVFTPTPQPVSDSGVSTALLAAILGLVAVAVVGLILIRRRRTTTVEDE